ncbi:Hpt domain-containing protein [Fundidesulfovibrio agrisoli]|uniref:Hpt domain-containing protein n=1 Tax=Fundidesulfovibrio agrisoli TaxID=2922717 RepID=UPI001FAB8B54|nr:Hpt domain-containing protein [Fundidesulfovibrio agrisoli]
MSVDTGAVPEPLRPLLPEFAASSRRTLAQVRAAVAAGEREAAREAAHSLKGPCQFFQLRELAEAAKRAEESLLRGEDAGAELAAFEALLGSLE